MYSSLTDFPQAPLSARVSVARRDHLCVWVMLFIQTMLQVKYIKNKKLHSLSQWAVAAPNSVQLLGGKYPIAETKEIIRKFGKLPESCANANL